MNCCLSEEIFDVISNEESHLMRRSFLRTTYKIRQDDKTLYYANLILYTSPKY